MKKKTLSKCKVNENPSNESEGCFMSPFGLVSPMNNSGKSRVSNVMKSCVGMDILSMVDDNRQQTLTATFGQIRPSIPQSVASHCNNHNSAAVSVFSNYTGKEIPASTTS